MREILFIIVALYSITSFVASSCTSSTIGKEFRFGILNSIGGKCCKTQSNIVAIDITNASPNDATVKLLIPYLNNDTSIVIPTGQNKTFLIDSKIQRDGTFVDTRGIKITSDNDIAVLVTNSFISQASIDSYNVLPTGSLGNKYILSSHRSDTSSRGGVVLVSGPINNTNVTIYKGSNVLKSAIINKFDVFQYACSTCDLTGVIVTSNKDIFVVSGTGFTQIPASSSQDEFIASEIFPTSAWSNKYIVPPVYPKSTFMLRLQSEDELINIEITNTSRTYTLKRTLDEQYFGNKPVCATANNSFLLTQYGVGYDYDNIKGDPFMTVVPGLDQYLNDYKFTVPDEYYSVEPYVAVIVQKSQQTGLNLDSMSIHAFNNGPINTFNVPSPFDTYVIQVFKIKAGFHHFFHSEKRNFGVFVYGLGLRSSYGLGYGFYPGYNLKGGSCQGSTTFIPSTAATISSTAAYLTTTVTSHTNSSTCYKCDDITHVGLCDTVETCKHNEICFIERFTESGLIKYMSGCIDERTCYLKHNDSEVSDDRCFDCCQGDYCNNKGCGENDIPDRQNRGPICYDCEHVRSPDECVTISPCETHQTCSIEEYKWFGSTHFKLGCGHGSCGFVNEGHMVKRATPICHSCCTEDYCNKNCTNPIHDGSVIVG